MFVELPLVNQIRPRVKAWREADYPGVTGITKRLLEHWRDAEERRDRRFFFCQLEAIETLIWLAEASPAERQGIGIPGDGGPFTRICSKMATGSGKTIVTAMLIAWHVLNKVTYPQDKRFSRSIFVVAPGLTVRSRLQVLIPDNPGGSYYDEFNIVPPGLVEKLRQGSILVRNWHVLNWETDEQIARKRSADKRGASAGGRATSPSSQRASRRCWPSTPQINRTMQQRRIAAKTGKLSSRNLARSTRDTDAWDRPGDLRVSRCLVRVVGRARSIGCEEEGRSRARMPAWVARLLQRWGHD